MEMYHALDEKTKDQIAEDLKMNMTVIDSKQTFDELLVMCMVMRRLKIMLPSTS